MGNKGGNGFGGRENEYPAGGSGRAIVTVTKTGNNWNFKGYIIKTLIKKNHVYL